MSRHSLNILGHNKHTNKHTCTQFKSCVCVKLFAIIFSFFFLLLPQLLFTNQKQNFHVYWFRSIGSKKRRTKKKWEEETTRINNVLKNFCVPLSALISKSDQFLYFFFLYPIPRPSPSFIITVSYRSLPK